VLYCKEERMSSPLLVLNLTMQYVLYSSSLIARMRSTLLTPLQGGEEKYTVYYSSPPCDSVSGLILVLLYIMEGEE
jgi:hypothetical protein